MINKDIFEDSIKKAENDCLTFKTSHQMDTEVVYIPAIIISNEKGIIRAIRTPSNIENYYNLKLAKRIIEEE